MNEPLIPQPVTEPVQRETSDDTRTIVTVLLLIFITPIGLLLMWFWSRWKAWVKILVTIVVLFPLILIILFISGILVALAVPETFISNPTVRCQSLCNQAASPSACMITCREEQGRAKLSTITPSISVIPIIPIVDRCDPKTATYLPPFTEVWPQSAPTVVIINEQGESAISETYKKDDGTIVVNVKSSGSSKYTVRIEQGNPNQKPTAEELAEFRRWASQRDIALYGVSKSYDELEASDFNLDKDSVQIGDIQLVMNTYKGLKLLPESILAMLRGQAIYFSTFQGKPNQTVYIHKTPSFYIITDKTSKQPARGGIFLVQPVSVKVAIHEIGHLAGTYGIEGYRNINPKFTHVFPQYESIFKMQSLNRTPCGYVTSYATTNKAENFAEHFAFYVVEGEKFREKATTDALLHDKYEFLKNYIFEGREY